MFGSNCDAGTVNPIFSCPPVATKLEVSNHGKFVVLEVDGSNKLEVGMKSNLAEEVIYGQLRLALGGALIDKDKMIVQVQCANPLLDTFYFHLSYY